MCSAKSSNLIQLRPRYHSKVPSNVSFRENLTLMLVCSGIMIHLMGHSWLSNGKSSTFFMEQWRDKWTIPFHVTVPFLMIKVVMGYVHPSKRVYHYIYNISQDLRNECHIFFCLPISDHRIAAHFRQQQIRGYIIDQSKIENFGLRRRRHICSKFFGLIEKTFACL